MTASAQVGIGTNTPHASAKLEVSSTNQGFLPPRVALTSVTDVATIASPATGLMVYCNGSAGLSAGYYFWNGSTWINFIASNTSTGLTNDQTGTSYTLTSADNGKIITLNNASAINLTRKEQALHRFRFKRTF